MNKAQYKRYRHNQRLWNRGEEYEWSQQAHDYFNQIPLDLGHRDRGNFYRGNLVKFWKDLHDPDNYVWGTTKMSSKMKEFRYEMKRRY